MSKINYFDGTKYVEVEVKEDVAKVYLEISQEEKREHWREQKRQIECSIDEMLERGKETASEKNVIEDYIVKEELENLHKAMDLLLPEQKELVYKIFYSGQALKTVADDLGISYQAIQNRLNKILEKIRKNL